MYVGMELGIYRLLSTNACTTSLFFSGSLFSGFYGQCPLKLCITGMLAGNKVILIENQYWLWMRCKSHTVRVRLLTLCQKG